LAPPDPRLPPLGSMWASASLIGAPLGAGDVPPQEVAADAQASKVSAHAGPTWRVSDARIDGTLR